MKFRLLDKIKINCGETPSYGVIIDFKTVKGVEKAEFVFSENGFVGEVTLDNIEKIKSLVTPGKHLTKLLRHDPENLKMDKEGYVTVKSITKKLDITRAELRAITDLDNKGRFAFSEDSEKIRATQGHSIDGIEMRMEKILNPNLIMYHGTSEANYKNIKETGLLKAMSRQYVHLSGNIETARKVGLRHAKNRKDLVVFEIKSKDLISNGIDLFISENGVYQSGDIPFDLFDKIWKHLAFLEKENKITL